MALSKTEQDLLPRVTSALMDTMAFTGATYQALAVLTIYSKLEPWQRDEMNKHIANVQKHQDEALENMRRLVADITELGDA
ncbi:hypothetical protein IVA86_33195 [Bradyrhizobium sp. 146]|uniref:hypothetical protein n=1 Tax=Bradyrhizobium sp. 146 TaxID=2782622 RepID=UPI001FFB524B|nr:hypothetical protein [Bradyrhizobium sp. 146]MCK1706130.1 hypothetical protein [Bradyrhizobium sp. 146]